MNALNIDTQLHVQRNHVTEFEYQASLQLDLTSLHGKILKAVADLVRNGIKNIHGYAATTGISDERLSQWKIIVRFATKECRDRFEDVITQVIHPDLIEKIIVKRMKPMGSVTRPVRILRGDSLDIAPRNPGI